MAAQLAEVAAHEASLQAEQEARDAEFAERTAREATLEAERQAARDARSPEPRGPILFNGARSRAGDSTFMIPADPLAQRTPRLTG